MFYCSILEINLMMENVLVLMHASGCVCERERESACVLCVLCVCLCVYGWAGENCEHVAVWPYMMCPIQTRVLSVFVFYFHFIDAF